MPKRIPTSRPNLPLRHSRIRSQQYERQPSRQADKNFYSSKRWMSVRRLKLSLNPLCEDCYQLGRVEPAKDVHHRKERKDFPDLAYDLENLQSLCKPCHNGKRRTR